MAHDDDDDFFGEDFDFVDDEDGDEGSTDEAEGSSSELVEGDEAAVSEPKEKQRTGRGSRSNKIAADSDSDNADAVEKKEEEKEPEPEGPPADHVVHVYEHGEFKRTIQREFTAEDAEAFITEYNRTGKHYNRTALVAAKDGEPAAAL